MKAGHARALSEWLHAGRGDRVGLPEINHVARVAQQVSPEARAVAWLHDTVEEGLVTLGSLADEGLTLPQLVALWLLTRPLHGTYMDYVRRLANAQGEVGRIAREVKRADIRDNLTRPAPADMLEMRLPDGRYARAAALLGDEE